MLSNQRSYCIKATFAIVALLILPGCVFPDDTEHNSSEHENNFSVEDHIVADDVVNETEHNSRNSSDETDVSDPDDNEILEHDEHDEPGLNIRFEPFAEDFYRMPWPSDYRVTEQGTVDLSDFPQAEHLFIKTYRAEIEQIFGFSTTPVIYAAFDAHPGEESLPTPVQSIQVGSPVQLMELGEGCGHRVPIESTFDVDGDPFVDPLILKSSPLPGFVLKPQTSYAWIVLKHFGSPNEINSRAPESFISLLDDGVAQDPFLFATYAPLRECLSSAGLSAQDIAIATVFTTQDPITETRLMREVIIDHDKTAAPVVKSWEYWDAVSNNRPYASWRGTYDTPILQRGTPPYTLNGGGLVFDDEGLPTIQRWEEVPFVVTLPDPRSTPHPILFWMDGTGASLHGHIHHRHIQGALGAGFVVVTFSPQFHDARAVPGSENDRSPFNSANPEAARTTLRQQVVDTSYFVRLIRETMPYLENMPELNVDTIMYGGQSQGAIAGALVAAVEPAFHAYAFNGIGAYTSSTLIGRKDPVDFEEVLKVLFHIKRDIDRFHPIIQIAQLGADIADPINYAPNWRGWDGKPGGSHMLMVNGKLDHTTPYGGMNALAIAGNVPTLTPEGWTVDPWGLWNVPPASPPFRGNQHALNGAALTMGHYLNPDEGHFTIYREDRAADLFVNFWTSALEGTPTISFE